MINTQCTRFWLHFHFLENCLYMSFLKMSHQVRSFPVIMIHGTFNRATFVTPLCLQLPLISYLLYFYHPWRTLNCYHATLQHAKTRFHRGTLVSLTSCLQLVADYLPFSRISLLPSVLTTSNFSEKFLPIDTICSEWIFTLHSLKRANTSFQKFNKKTPWLPHKLRSDVNCHKISFQNIFKHNEVQ